MWFLGLFCWQETLEFWQMIVIQQKKDCDSSNNNWLGIHQNRQPLIEHLGTWNYSEDIIELPPWKYLLKAFRAIFGNVRQLFRGEARICEYIYILYNYIIYIYICVCLPSIWMCGSIGLRSITMISYGSYGFLGFDRAPRPGIFFKQPTKTLRTSLTI